jgi:hypothetical protein
MKRRKTMKISENHAYILERIRWVIPITEQKKRPKSNESIRHTRNGPHTFLRICICREHRKAEPWKRNPRIRIDAHNELGQGNMLKTVRPKDSPPSPSTSRRRRRSHSLRGSEGSIKERGAEGRRSCAFSLCVQGEDHPSSSMQCRHGRLLDCAPASFRRRGSLCSKGRGQLWRSVSVSVCRRLRRRIKAMGSNLALLCSALSSRNPIISVLAKTLTKPFLESFAGCRISCL